MYFCKAFFSLKQIPKSYWSCKTPVRKQSIKGVCTCVRDGDICSCTLPVPVTSTCHHSSMLQSPPRCHFAHWLDSSFLPLWFFPSHFLLTIFHHCSFHHFYFYCLCLSFSLSTPAKSFSPLFLLIQPLVIVSHRCSVYLFSPLSAIIKCLDLSLKC